MQELEKILEEIDEIKAGFDTECRSECDLYDWSCGACVGECDEYIKERAKEIIRKHMNAGWIPVEERLLIPNKEIWVTVKRNGNVFTSTDGMTEKGHFWNYEKENILAWKEKELIPEPYRPERRKK